MRIADNISYYNWRAPSLIELNPMIFNTGLTHLGSKTPNYNDRIHELDNWRSPYQIELTLQKNYYNRGSYKVKWVNTEIIYF